MMSICYFSANDNHLQRFSEKTYFTLRHSGHTPKKSRRYVTISKPLSSVISFVISRKLSKSGSTILLHLRQTT